MFGIVEKQAVLCGCFVVEKVGFVDFVGGVEFAAMIGVGFVGTVVC